MKILYIGYKFLGDILMSTPALAYLQNIWPNAMIDYYSTGQANSILANNPRVNKVFHQAKDLPINKYQLIIAAKGDFASSFLARKLKPQLHIGLDKEKNGILHPLKYHFKKDQHLIWQQMKLIDKLSLVKVKYSWIPSIDSSLKNPQMEYYHLNDSSTEDLPKDYLCFCVGSSRMEKKWPQKQWIALAKQIIKKKKGSIFIIGSQGEWQFAEEIVSSLYSLEPRNSYKINTSLINNLCGKTSLSQMYQLFTGASVVISNDTGPMHFASAAKRENHNLKVIGLFSYSNYKITGLLGKNTYNLYTDYYQPKYWEKIFKKKVKGMEDIHPDQIMEIIH